MLATEALTNLDRQTFPAEYVNDCQCAELPTVAELVMDKVQLQTSFGRFGWQRASRCTTILRRRGRLLRNASPSHDIADRSDSDRPSSPRV